MNRTLPAWECSVLSRARAARAKRAFTTRRVPLRDMRTLVTGTIRPKTGNIVLASVHELGKHRRIEQLNGRRALMMPGDEILVCYGNRYAPDQFEAVVSDDLGLCDLVAGGGIASREINRHDRMLPPTKIMPIGLVGNAHGSPLNLIDYRIDLNGSAGSMKVVLVAGTAMNAGKTFTAASIVRGLKESGYRVAGIKATGTGSGGDLWKMKDMGADVILDFTDAGFASTYKIPDEEIEVAVLGLINHAAKRRCNFAVVEVADGLQHRETATLLRSRRIRSIVSGAVFAAYDSLGARAGHQMLDQLGYQIFAISGQITRSPLAMREAASTNCAIYTPFEIQAGALVPTIIGSTDQFSVEHNADLVRMRTANPANYVVDFEPRQDDTLWTRSGPENRPFDYPDDLGETA